MPDASFRSLFALVDTLYAAAVNLAAWPNFLGSVAALFDAEHAFICQAENRIRPFDYIGLKQTDRDLIPVSDFATLMHEDPRKRAFDLSLGRAVHCRMAVSTDDLHRSRVYRHYLNPLDFEYTLVVSIQTRAAFTHDLGVVRSRSKPPFDATDCELLNELVPHLSRAFDIRRKLNERAPSAPAPVAVAPPPHRPMPSAQSEFERVREHFNLAPSQARLALAISQGRTVREAAGMLGVTEQSARQYLRRIFKATGVNRQVDLVRIVGRVLDKPQCAVST